ncbi:MAG: hypothetical protein F4X12_12995 [Acidobacteriia bacterium]|nr:hypothetical protein [Terriglobia bacterium]
MIENEFAEASSLSVFLLAPQPPHNAGFSRDPLLHAGQTSLGGKIWCVNAPVRMGWGADLETADHDQMFVTVTDDLGLGDCPAIILDPRPAVMRAYHYPRGLDFPDECVEVGLRADDVDIGRLSDVAERIYLQFLRTPDAQPTASRLWRDSRRHRPDSAAESKIQTLLLAAFQGALPTCRVWFEFAGVMGRADIHIVEHDPLDYLQVTHLAVLELKVLRSFSANGTPYSDSDNQTWVEQGIRQAEAYRDEHGHRVAALYCFDMRREDTGEGWFEPWHRLAQEKCVALKRWYLFATSALAREA